MANLPQETIDIIFNAGRIAGIEEVKREVANVAFNEYNVKVGDINDFKISYGELKNITARIIKDE